MRMLKIAILLLGLAFMSAPARAQTPDIVGRWQGQIIGGPRMILMVERDQTGAYAGEYYLIDTSAHPTKLGAIDFRDGVFTFADGTRRYRGVLSSDGARINGSPFDFQRAPETDAWPLPSAVSHTVMKMMMNDGVTVEVVDWGGSGPPLVFLAGLGSDAHVFDFFAPRFTSKHRVYGISRRGFGGSDKPDPDKASYATKRLADDVLQVIAQLKLDRPTLAGWSFGGAEMSSIGTRAPEKAAGLVYLDGAYTYAYYEPGLKAQPDASLMVAVNDLRDRLRNAIGSGLSPAESVAALDDLLARNLPELKTDIEMARAYYQSPLTPANPARPLREPSLDDRISRAIREGEQKFTGVKLPLLALFATVWPPQASAPEDQRERTLRLAAAQEQSIGAFEAAHPHGRIVRLLNAQHAVFLSSPDEVFREMDAFMDGLAR